jgi:hypothetical protein
MKSFLSLIALGAVAFGVANPVFASDYKFKNIGSFTANGSMTVSSIAISVPCQATLDGATDGRRAEITAATFSGLTCIAVSPGGLPWGVRATSAHSLTISDVTVRAVVLGICGPGKVSAQLNKTGKITISGAGLPSSLGATPCSLDATLMTTPKLEIVPKS